MRFEGFRYSVYIAILRDDIFAYSWDYPTNSNDVHESIFVGLRGKIFYQLEPISCLIEVLFLVIATKTLPIPAV